MRFWTALLGGALLISCDPMAPCAPLTNGTRVVFVASVDADGRRIVVISSIPDSGGRRLFIGPPDRLVEQEIRHVSLAKSGTNIIDFVLGDAAGASARLEPSGKGSLIVGPDAPLELTMLPPEVSWTPAYLCR